MATYVVGDIQGCLEPLQCLLEAVAFDPDRDTLWSVGDVVNRGTDCLGTLRLLYELRDSLVMVLGNHDLHLLAVAAGARKLGRSDTLANILKAPDSDELLSWLQTQPLLHHEHGHTMVHAGIPPHWSLEDAQGYAAEVEHVLRGPKAKKFFKAMYGNEPAQWSPSLKGMDRLRAITNYFTRMRFCTAAGELDLSNKTAKATKANTRPWFAHQHRAMEGQTIVFGHWAAIEGYTGRADAIALDTGCVWGGRLTFYRLDDQEVTYCNCRYGKPA